MSTSVPSTRVRHAVPAGVAHAAHNGAEGAVQFLIGGQPGTIASYLAQFDEA